MQVKREKQMYARNIHLLAFDSTGIDLISHPKEMSLCLKNVFIQQKWLLIMLIFLLEQKSHEGIIWDKFS